MADLKNEFSWSVSKSKEFAECKRSYYYTRYGFWEGRPQYSHDSVVKRSKEKFLENVKNTYRVLLSRGMKGCYVYFMDEETRNFFMSRFEK